MSEKKSKQLRKLERRLDKLEQVVAEHKLPWWERLLNYTAYAQGWKLKENIDNE